MDDALYGMGTLGLQRDSEFLQIFNHYIMKEMESGFLKRLFYKYHGDLFTKERFEMVEPQPLGFNNVMFCFIMLALGICLSIVIVMMELINSKLIMHQLWATRRSYKTREHSEVQQWRKRRNHLETLKIRFNDGSRPVVVMDEDKD